MKRRKKNDECTTFLICPIINEMHLIQNRKSTASLTRACRRRVIVISLCVCVCVTVILCNDLLFKIIS